MAITGISALDRSYCSSRPRSRRPAPSVFTHPTSRAAPPPRGAFPYCRRHSAGQHRQSRAVETVLTEAGPPSRRTRPRPCRDPSRPPPTTVPRTPKPPASTVPMRSNRPRIARIISGQADPRHATRGQRHHAVGTLRRQQSRNDERPHRQRDGRSLSPDPAGSYGSADERCAYCGVATTRCATPSPANGEVNAAP